MKHYVVDKLWLPIIDYDGMPDDYDIMVLDDITEAYGGDMDQTYIMVEWEE